uniref:Auxin-responsive protein n=1 Tax=Aegilops tauschii TaxID=37682 RepID=M8BLJ6_AEGTA
MCLLNPVRRRRHADDDGMEELTELTLVPSGKRARRAGWEQARTRKNATVKAKLVMVSMDGSSYMHKVDVGAYGDYVDLVQEHAI